MEIFPVSQLSTVGRHVTHTRLSGSTSAPCVTRLNPNVSSLVCSLDRSANLCILVFGRNVVNKQASDLKFIIGKS